jgi:hypothetical protein
VVSGCCTNDADCDDGDPCSLDACDGTTHQCTHAPICDAGADASGLGDGAPDAVGGAPSHGGCGCVAPGAARFPPSDFVTGLALGAWATARRRPRRSRRSGAGPGRGDLSPRTGSAEQTPRLAPRT